MKRSWVLSLLLTCVGVSFIHWFLFWGVLVPYEGKTVVFRSFVWDLIPLFCVPEFLVLTVLSFLQEARKIILLSLTVLSMLFILSGAWMIRDLCIAGEKGVIPLLFGWTSPLFALSGETWSNSWSFLLFGGSCALFTVFVPFCLWSWKVFESPSDEAERNFPRYGLLWMVCYCAFAVGFFFLERFVNGKGGGNHFIPIYAFFLGTVTASLSWILQNRDREVFHQRPKKGESFPFGTYGRYAAFLFPFLGLFAAYPSRTVELVWKAEAVGLTSWNFGLFSQKLWTSVALSTLFLGLFSLWRGRSLWRTMALSLCLWLVLGAFLVKPFLLTLENDDSWLSFLLSPFGVLEPVGGMIFYVLRQGLYTNLPSTNRFSGMIILEFGIAQFGIRFFHGLVGLTLFIGEGLHSFIFLFCLLLAGLATFQRFFSSGQVKGASSR